METHIEGFADLRVTWGLAGPIPAEYTLRLKRATPIGGFVLDEDGKPVPGAEVDLISLWHFVDGQSRDPLIETCGGAEKAITDGDGRWRLSRFDRNGIWSIQGKATHPDYPSSAPTLAVCNTNPAAEQQLLASTYVFSVAHGTPQGPESGGQEHSVPMVRVPSAPTTSAVMTLSGNVPQRDHRRSHTPFPRDFALVAAFDP